MPQKIPDVPLMSPTKPLLTDLAEGSGGSSTEESLKKKTFGDLVCIFLYYPLLSVVYLHRWPGPDPPLTQ